MFHKLSAESVCVPSSYSLDVLLDALHESTNPMLFYASCDNIQQDLLKDFVETAVARRQQEILDQVDAAYPPRKIYTLSKILVCDYPPPGKTGSSATIHLDGINGLQEGKRYKVCGD